VATATAAGQGAPRAIAATGEVHGGWAGFLDDARIDHLAFGGAARWRVTPRMAIGPEVTWLRGPGNDRDVYAHVTLTWDLRAGPCLAGCAVPYLVAAGGFVAHRSGFNAPAWSLEGAAAGGGGVRVQLTDRFHLAGEARVGWEPHARLTLAAGWRF
jgi:hypothetical protein